MIFFRLSIPVVVLAIAASYAPASAQDQVTLSPPSSPRFDPHSYPKSVAHCSAINRATSELTEIDLRECSLRSADGKQLIWGFRICGGQPHRKPHPPAGSRMARLMEHMVEPDSTF